jgi:membrane-associated phospholipid phosphatase
MSRSTHRGIVGLALLVGATLACADPATTTLTGPGSGPSTARSTAPIPNAPTSPAWQGEAQTLVAAARLDATAAARIYAALAVGQYRAVMDADGKFDVEGTLPEHGLGTGGRRLLEARRGAVAGASAAVLSYFFPSTAASLEARVRTIGAAGPGSVHPHFTRGLEIGRDAGTAMVVRLEADRFTTPWTGTFPVGPDTWSPNPGAAPIGATLAGATPYLLASADQFRPAAPPEFGSPAFQAAVAEIRTLVDNRTPEQLAVATLWNYAAGTLTPPGYWMLTAGTYIGEDRLDERAATHVFAVLGATMYDAFIGCFDAKYHYLTPRPSQADPAIVAPPRLPTGRVPLLPNHPSYPAGHSCNAAAAATVLTHFFPDRGADLAGQVTDAGLARMYAGIHYRFDVAAGQQLGAAVADWVIGIDERTGLLAALR